MEWSTPFIVWIATQFVCFLAVLLVLKFSTSLSWPMVICWSVFIGQIAGFIVLPYYTCSWGTSQPLVALMQAGVFLPAIVCAVVLIVRLVAWLPTVAFSEGRPDVSERSRILQMVEDGKISADEGSELLDAMGRSTALRGQEKLSRADIVMLVGAGLVILGFFLPWAYIRMHQVRGPFGNVSAYQAGHHVGALGWAIFIIAVVSAVPVFVTPKDFLYKISMLQIFLILIGLVLVISVLVRAGSNLGVGLIICLAGFVVELCASAAKFRKLAA